MCGVGRIGSDIAVGVGWHIAILYDEYILGVHSHADAVGFSLYEKVVGHIPHHHAYNHQLHHQPEV